MKPAPNKPVVDDAVGCHPRWWRRRGLPPAQARPARCRTVRAIAVPLPISGSSLCLQPLIRSAGGSQARHKPPTASPRRPHCRGIGGRWPRAGWHSGARASAIPALRGSSTGASCSSVRRRVAPDPPRPGSIPRALVSSKASRSSSSKPARIRAASCRNGGCERTGIRWEPGQTIAAGSLRHSPAPQ